MSDRSTRLGLILKLAVFATGLAGITAEFVLSTLATYLLGSAVFQWTVVMSLMLFAMGVGSRISKFVSGSLLEVFIAVEFGLSLLCASTSAAAYGLAGYSDDVNLLIYFLAGLIGCLIGLEIPLVTRINEEFEELRTNIASIMEKDYYGSLAGGVLFAFFALPYLGLTYTPIALGAVNFTVASVVLFSFSPLIKHPKRLKAAFAASLVFLISLTALADPIILHSEQARYRDKIIYSEQTPYQRLVLTKYRDYYWLYINGQEQFSSFDEEKYHEPLVHPAMKLAAARDEVLILGGGDGLALREVLKYKDVKRVTLVDLDPAMTKLAATNPILRRLNRESMTEKRVTIVSSDARMFVEQHKGLFDVIIIDLPDPDTIDLMHLYSLSFYRLIRHSLKAGGIMVAQAASPYFARQAFLCIYKTIAAAGFSVLPIHNQIPTMGQWGWIIGAREADVSPAGLKRRAEKLEFKDVETRFINNSAMISMTHFGKGIIDQELIDKIEVNTQFKPVLKDYYWSGSWSMY